MRCRRRRVVHGRVLSEHVDPNYYWTDHPVVYGDPANTDAMRFVGKLACVPEGGTMVIDASGIHVRGASHAIILFAAATSFNGFDRSPGKDGADAEQIASQHLQAALRRTYEQLRSAHQEDFQALFDRLTFELGPAPEGAEELTTDERIIRYGADDLKLVELLFHYGRYLLISSSRPGSEPANLQGIWNDEVRPPWSCNFTMNINAQMNYWLAEPCHLPECHDRFCALLRSWHKTGAKRQRLITELAVG